MTKGFFSCPKLPGKFHRFVFPVFAVWALAAVCRFQQAADEGGTAAEDEPALGMGWTTALLAVLMAGCFCCCCFCVN